VIRNDGSPEQTRREVCAVWKKLQEREQRNRG